MGDRDHSRARVLHLAAAVACAIGCCVFAAEEEAPAPGDEVTTSANLLVASPFDRITLVDGEIIECEPVTPRPPHARARRPAQEEVNVRLLEGEERDFTVLRRDIKEIKYFEEMLLEAGDRLLEAKDFEGAFRHYQAVRRLTPEWPELASYFEKLLIREARHRIAGGEIDRGLHLYYELKAYNPDDAGLEEEVAGVVDGLIGDAVMEGRFAAGRRYLRGLRRSFGGGAVATKWLSHFTDSAKALMDKAVESESAGAHRKAFQLAGQAVEVWPNNPDINAAFNRIGTRYQVLTVAVRRMPARFAPWRSPLEPERRAADLTHLRLLTTRGESGRRQYAGRLVAETQKSDFDRAVTFHLRQDVMWSDGAGPVTALDVSRTISALADSELTSHDPRWSRLLRRVRTPSAFEITVELVRPYPTTEDLFLFNVAPVLRLGAGRIETRTDALGIPAGAGLFRVRARGDEQVVYEANPLDGDAAECPIREIIEREFGDEDEAVRLLRRGEIALIGRIAPWRARELREEAGIRLGTRRRPAVHLLTFNYRRPALRNRTLRKAIAYAINTRGILETLLPAGPDGELVSGPFARDSFAYDESIDPRPFDRTLAWSLAETVRLQRGGQLQRLTLAYPAIEEVRVACEAIRDNLKAAGIEVEIIERSQPDLENEVANGRDYDLAYRILRLGEEDPIGEVSRLFCSGVRGSVQELSSADVASPWLKQLFVQLENETHWPAVRAGLREVHRLSYDDAAIVPLWQLTEHFAFNSRLRGIEPVQDALYQGVETWEVEPWFAKDPQ